MTIEAFSLLKSKVLSDLDEKLDPLLTYHCRKHTEDVLFHTERIALSENIKTGVAYADENSGTFSRYGICRYICGS